MKQRIKTVFAGGVLALALFRVAVAGQLEDGQAAYERSDYAPTMSYWQPLADQGNVIAQAKLGLMYAKRQGMPQDYAQSPCGIARPPIGGSPRADPARHDVRGGQRRAAGPMRRPPHGIARPPTRSTSGRSPV